MTSHYNIRVAEVLRTISRAGDVASARPFGFGQRVATVAMALAREVELAENVRGDLLLAGLLHGVGVAAVGGPLARLVLGNERKHLTEFPVDALLAVLAEEAPQDMEGEASTGVYIRHHLELLRFPTYTHDWLMRAGLHGAARICRGMLERVDGQGAPAGLVGDQIPRASRVLALAYYLASVRQLGQLPDELWRGQHDLNGADWVRAAAGRIFDPELVEAAEAVWADAGNWRQTHRSLGEGPSLSDEEDTHERAIATEAHSTQDGLAPPPTTVDDTEGVKTAEREPASGLGELMQNYVHGLHDVDEDVPDVDRYIDNLLFEEYGGFLEPHSPTLEAWLGILATMADVKAAFDEGHGKKIAALAREIGLAFELTDAELVELRLASMLFGAGRLALPSSLLESTSSLAAGQRRMLQEYPRVTRSILSPMAALGDTVLIAYLHAERMDGSGYPEGRGGDDTPLAARILAVAATYMALISERPYRHAHARSRALAILQAQSGALFDGLVTDSLEAVARGQIEPLPMSDTDLNDTPLTEGTHPVAMLSLVAAIAGLITSTCICVYPPLAPMLPALCGLPAVIMAAWTLFRVRQGRWAEGNRFQARLGLGLGVLDLLLAAAWGALILNQGADLGLGL